MKEFIDFINRLNSGNIFYLTGYSKTSFSLFTALLKEFTDKNIFLVVPDREIAQDIYSIAREFSQKDIFRIFNIPKFYPFSHILKTKSFPSDIIDLLYTILSSNNRAIIIPSSLLLKKYPQTSFLPENILTIKKNETIERDTLAYYLLEYGYENSYILSDKGEFSIRGDIIDIFIPIYDKPVRITLWDEFVEDINFFNIETQKRYKNIEIKEINILPNTEFIYNENNLEKILPNLKTNRERELGEILKLKNSDINISLCSTFSSLKTSSIFDYVQENQFISIFYNFSQSLKNLRDYEYSLIQHFEELSEEGINFVNYENYFHKFEDIEKQINNIEIIADEIPLFEKERTFIDLKTKTYKKKFESEKEIINEVDKHNTILIFSDNIRKENIKKLLKIQDDSKSVVDILINKKNKNFILNGTVSEGFYSEFFDISIITEKNIFGRARRFKKSFHLEEHKLLKFSELKIGDYIVHLDHGIGIFKGLKNLKIGDIKREFIELEYLNQDKLFVPVEKFNLIQKYVGEEGYIPTIDRLGGERWNKAKERVSKEVETVAKELLEHYAQRKIIKGIAFNKNDEIIEEFSMKWEFNETEDQRKAIEEVFSDMEKEYPMDRLLCGDVGYGKTEVAIRAILKAVFSGYQVAFLVPTTILALQHFENLKERFKDYPIKVSKISRFETKKEQVNILKQTEKGEIDVLIGTHRLIQKDVKWKNLGLLIIDEEHKFGVKHKENIQLLKKDLDVLSMTATPIPRTLQMACLGVKDLSLINIPPADRQSIETVIMKFDKKIIRKAILKEIDRGGQVYFVHNNISSIYQMADSIKEIVPEVKIAVAYGQMDKKDLEIIYKDFIEKRYHILVCTTIIESGLDNPNVNTIFVNRADKFGISQLYQLRGRVGRSNVKAYAYFIIPQQELISKLALKRLNVLYSHSGLSEGFKLAMSDLEIRGAGTLFGEKQSGHILSVGFEYYIDMLENAIKKLKGEKKVEELEPEIVHNIEAFIPEEYILDEKERLYLYKKLSIAQDFNSLQDISLEIEDRFGRFPIQMTNLINILKIKILLKKFYIPKADYNGQSIVLTFIADSKIDSLKVLSILQNGNVNNMSLVNQDSLKIIFKSNTLQEQFNELMSILEEFKAG